MPYVGKVVGGGRQDWGKVWAGCEKLNLPVLAGIGTRNAENFIIE